LPSTFWKDRRENLDGTSDPDAMRANYIGDGRRVAGGLADRDGVLAIWLSGPFTEPRICPDSDLHMSVLDANSKTVYYHHVPAAFSQVSRRLEIAFFPNDYFRSIIDRGFADWTDVFDSHKLFDIRVLHDPNGILSALRDRVRKAAATHVFVGRQIVSLRSGYQEMRECERRGAYREAVLAARKLLMNALRLAVLVGRGMTFSKAIDLYPSIMASLPSSEHACLTDLLAIGSSNRQRAVECVEDTDTLVKAVFERLVLCGDASN